MTAVTLDRADVLLDAHGLCAWYGAAILGCRLSCDLPSRRWNAAE